MASLLYGTPAYNRKTTAPQKLLPYGVAKIARFLYQKELEYSASQIFLIGSTLADRAANDFDVLVYLPSSTTVSEAEQLMSSIRLWGKSQPFLTIAIDPIATIVHPNQIAKQYSGNLIRTLFFLDSPNTIQQNIGVPIGKFLAASTKKEKSRSYDSKLPIMDNQPYLRPAIRAKDYVKSQK